MAMTNFVNKVASVLSYARYVKYHYQRGFCAQALDIRALYRANPTCNIFDYYQYQVYNAVRGSALYTELLGTGELEAFNRSLNPRNAVTPAWNKMVFNLICNAYNLPTPKLLAVYKPAGPLPDFVPQKLTSIDQLKAFLQNEKGPIFVKPVKSSLGQGAFFIASVDADCEYVFNKQGTAIRFDEFLDKTINLTGARHYNPNAGVLFQQPVLQHAAITEFTQTDTPSGLRVLVLNTGDGPYIHRVSWRLIGSDNISDNFSKGTYGNMIAQVDPKTGVSSAAVNAYWPKTKLYQQHPVSGRDFSSFTLPLWPQVIEEVLRASSAISDMGAMHWDVIITETGVVLLELNDIGGTDILQLHGQGLIDKQLKSSLQRKAVLIKGSAFARFVQR